MQLLEWKGRGQGTIVDPYLLEGSSQFDTTLPFNIKISDNFRNENRKHNYFRIQGNNIVYILSMLVTDYDHLLYHKTTDVFPFILIGTDLNNMIDGPFIISQYEGNNYISKQQLFSHNDITSSSIPIITPINDDMNIEIEVEYDLDNSKIYINSNVKLKDDEDNLIKETESKELYVSHSDILADINNKIAEHNTDISSHMNIQNALKDYTDSELSNHDSDLTSHSDIRANIRYIEETKADKTKLVPINNELVRLKNEKADKIYVDAQDANVLQEAKDYTYDRDTIDNKDANVLQEAKDYTYSQVEIDNKDAAIMNKANDLENDKVDKTTTIIGLDLRDDILIDEFRTALGNASQSYAGLLSAEDKTHLDGLVALLETSDGNNVVDTIGEILAIFQNYPEGADLVTALNGKVDKVAGKGLSQNDFTDALKNKLDGLLNGSQYYDKTYIDALKDKNGWESELLGTLSNNETIDLSVINQYDEIQMYAKDTLGVIDNENIRPSLMQSGDSVYFFDDTQAFIMVDTVFGFYAPVGYTLQVVGIKYTELKAIDTTYDNTVSEMNATNVQGAIDELDTRVKANTDNVALKVNTSDIVNNLTSTDTTKPLSANQGKVLNDTTAKLASSNVFTQPQQVPNATLPQHTTNLSQVETMFEMFKQQLRGYNLPPDLTGKEYLGDGVYRLHNNNGITIDYNVYNGEYKMNGTSTSYFNVIIFNVLPDTEYTLSYIAVSGTVTDGPLNIRVFSPSTLIIQQLNENINKQATFTTTTQTTFRFETGSNTTFDNYTFKLQLEKGSTATPYTVPGEIPQYKIVGEE